MTKIALVEDNRTTREGLQRIIDLWPSYKCICACETAEEALRLLPPQEPDIVLMDIQLPGMSGIECVGRLKELLPAAQVIMLTVYEDPDRVFSAIRAGASGYLLKRSTPEQVFSAVREVQEGGAPMSAPVALKVFSYFRNQAAASAEVENLSARESEILELIVQGFSNKEIAARLSLSIETLRWHLRHIYKKLHVHSRTDAALKFRPRM
ncbi:MAG TPA: response regulator transcription factor [Candidatus Binatia bacterium]|jgi:DNA-binding NarL/FixJ family response regulator|nr:response regulator transcription factor [Candidatus Binatia bacterium]